MAKGYRPVQRDQVFLLPPDMREWLPQGHLVWTVLDVVAAVDTSPFHVSRRVGAAGRAGFDPDMLLALLVYAYACGERSSRQIERLCEVDVAFRIACGGDVPDHCTLARFRAVNEPAFAELFSAVLVVCARAGLGRFGLVALDGTKIAANASVAATRDEEWLRAEAQRITAEAAAVDAEEDAELGEARGDELPAELADPSRRAARIRECLEQIEAERAADAAAAQPDEAASEAYFARIAAGENVSGSTPTGVDKVEAARRRLERARARQQAKIDAHTARGGAGRAPTPVEERTLVRQAREALERAEARAQRERERREQAEEQQRRRRNVTDPDSRPMPSQRGWVQGFNAQLVVTDDQLIVATDVVNTPNDVNQFEPMMEAAVDAVRRVRERAGRPDAHIGTLLADAGYLSEDNLTAPGPDRLIATGKRHAVDAAARAHPEHSPPPDSLSARDQMAHRLRTPDGVARYRRRGVTVEPVNASIKDRLRLRRFSRRGVVAARSELDLVSAAHNILKLHRAGARIA